MAELTPHAPVISTAAMTGSQYRCVVGGCCSLRLPVNSRCGHVGYDTTKPVIPRLLRMQRLYFGWTNHPHRKRYAAHTRTQFCLVPERNTRPELVQPGPPMSANRLGGCSDVVVLQATAGNCTSEVPTIEDSARQTVHLPGTRQWKVHGKPTMSGTSA